MSHTLTEADSYATSVSVPSGGDPRTAASVDAPLQTLTDRTKNLDARLASIGVGRVTNDGADASIALLSSTKKANDDDHVGNLYKLIFAFPSSLAAAHCRMYTALGGFAFTQNAVWDPATALWAQDSAAQDSVRLMVFAAASSGVAIDQRAAGSAPWADSDWIYPATALHGYLQVSGEVFYPNPKSRTTLMKLVPHQPDDPTQWALNSSYMPRATADGVTTSFLIHLPRGARLEQLVIAHYQNTAAFNVIDLVRRTINTAAPSISLTTLGTVNGPASSGAKSTTLVLGSAETIDNDGHDYMVRFYAAKANNEINGITLDWTDPGPSNV